MICVEISFFLISQHSKHNVNCHSLSTINIPPTHLPCIVCRCKVGMWAICLNGQSQRSWYSINCSDSLPFARGANTPQKGRVLFFGETFSSPWLTENLISFEWMSFWYSQIICNADKYSIGYRVHKAISMLDRYQISGSRMTLRAKV